MRSLFIELTSKQSRCQDYRIDGTSKFEIVSQAHIEDKKIKTKLAEKQEMK
ncbi:hypothetical protein SBF1_1680002 [Candidatus Desulfosporosinus infrequens]|uniref:Uncharacterized protein n=1 Tax=Candidatus Desulfosporosinus infrequens TaxID=2043169 RepID=A0A2U3KAS4_9FIRM|nr:hypothetical protein SBF1_1680002 [Candidatus Desulfosporosinus infrequens]